MTKRLPIEVEAERGPPKKGYNTELFPGSPLPQYLVGPVMFNFADRTRSGALITVWSYPEEGE